MHKYRIPSLPAWLILLLLFGCSKPAGQAVPLPAIPTPPDAPAQITLPPSPTATIGQVPTPTNHPATPAPRPQYTLSASLDYWEHILVVEEKIDYTNNAPEPLPDLLFVVEPLRYEGVFTLTRFSFVSGPPINPIEEGPLLRIPLPSPLQPGETVSLSLSYQLDLPSPVPTAGIRPIPFGYTSRQTNLVDWYPFIPPYVPGKGWLTNPASYYGEHLSYEISDFTVRIRLAESTLPLVIAASSAAKSDGEWTVYQHESARNFAWSVSHEYQQLTAQAGPVTVTSYYFPIHAKAGQAALQTTLESVQLYSRLFGPYQHKYLSVVEADFLDGMEFDGLYFLSQGFYNLYTGTPAEYLVSIAAHETAHQWWYGQVGNDQANEPWLDEALCTYSERLYYENVHPEALDWWWGARVNYYSPRGWVDTSIYNPQGDAQAYQAYRAAVYLNGAVFLEELRSTIGDEVYFEFLHTYATTNLMRLVDGNDFFDLLQSMTSKDLQDLLTEYFSRLYFN